MPDPARDTISDRGDFAPATSTARYFDRGPVTWPRLLLRVGVAALALVALDAWAGRLIGPPAYSASYRLPATLPSASVPGLARWIDVGDTRADSRPTVVFLGASPTWGYRVRDPRHTYPAAYAASAHAAGADVRVANIASNGQLLGDEYLLAKRSADSADVVFVQLTYHTFNPRFRNSQVVRYPEFATLPGVVVSAAEADLLGVSETARPKLAPKVSRLLADHWLLYRERAAVAQKLFGDLPEERLRAEWTKRVHSPSSETSEPAAVFSDEFAADRAVPFDQLDPDQQMIVINTYAENSSFTVDPASRQMRVLSRFVTLLRAKGRRAVFFMAPVNRDVLDFYDLWNREQYLANSQHIGRVIENAGATFIDYNTPEMPVFPMEYFADIDHATDEGGRAVGARLFKDTATYLQVGAKSETGESP